MFKDAISHIEFQSFLIAKLLLYYLKPHFKKIVINRAVIVYKVFLADLTPAREILKSTYNPRGETPWDPVLLFRSYWLMCQYGDRGSISKWVATLKSEPFWAVVSGFEPDNVPGVGTFYDFEDRLLDFDKGQRVKRTKTMRPSLFKPKEKFKKNQKKPAKTGIVERLIERIIRDEDKPQPLKANTLQRIFKACFITPSANKGLLGNLDKLVLAGDSIIFNSGGSSYGIKECDCWETKGLFLCSCKRRYSDPDANWGWDSHREKYVYGYSNYTFVAADSPHDLPLYSTLAQASRHDSVVLPYALYEMKLLNPEFNIDKIVLDSAHDNYPTYELLEHWNIEPFISLNERNSGNLKYDPPLKIDENGVPICKGGFKMVNWGYQKKRFRIKWRCPHVVLKSCNCPHFNSCSDSDYGRTIYTKSQWDKRIFTATPRGSIKWKKTMNKRTSSERRNSRVKVQYSLERDGVRSKSRWLIRTIMRDGALHADAWVKEAEMDAESWVLSWFNEQAAA